MGEANKKQHYVQKAILKKFSHTQRQSKTDVITIIDAKRKKIYDKNISDAFCIDKMYDFEECEDVKLIEKELNKKIEGPMSTILNRFDTLCHNEFTINRSELETIKKYILVQLYRNPRNRGQYKGEIDKWKKEMLHILQTPFDDLLNNSIGFDGVRLFAQDIHRSFMMIVRTRDEFCINDMGYATERMPCNAIPIASIDNYIVFPFSPHYAILKVDCLWKRYFQKLYSKNPMTPPSCSPILNKYLELPQNTYVNRDKISCELDIWSNRDTKDEYTYHIVDISKDDTDFLNTLTLNETLEIIGVHDVNAISTSIDEFRRRAKIGGARIDYDFFDDALKEYNDKKQQNK